MLTLEATSAVIHVTQPRPQSTVSSLDIGNELVVHMGSAHTTHRALCTLRCVHSRIARCALCTRPIASCTLRIPRLVPCVLRPEHCALRLLHCTSRAQHCVLCTPHPAQCTTVVCRGHTAHVELCTLHHATRMQYAHSAVHGVRCHDPPCALRFALCALHAPHTAQRALHVPHSVHFASRAAHATHYTL